MARVIVLSVVGIPDNNEDQHRRVPILLVYGSEALFLVKIGQSSLSFSYNRGIKQQSLGNCIGLSGGTSRNDVNQDDRTEGEN